MTYTDMGWGIQLFYSRWKDIESGRNLKDREFACLDNNSRARSNVDSRYITILTEDIYARGIISNRGNQNAKRPLR